MSANGAALDCQVNPPEEWREIAGFPNYKVSSLGRVRSWRRPWLPGHLLVPAPSRKMYLSVGLQRDGRSITTSVHQLVAEAFIGPRPPGLHIRHLDGNGSNNSAGNLRYGTRSENERDKLVHGRDPRRNRTHCPQGHEYTPENTRMERRPSRGDRIARVCRACQKVHHEEQRRRYVSKKRDDFHARCPNGHERNPINTHIRRNGRTQCRVCERERQRALTAAKRAQHADDHRAHDTAGTVLASLGPEPTTALKPAVRKRPSRAQKTVVS